MIIVLLVTMPALVVPLPGLGVVAQAQARQKPAPTKAAVSAVSRVRAEKGLRALRHDPLLEMVARRQAQAMAKADTLSHDVDGAFADRMNRSGIGYGTSAENLGYGYETLGEVIAGWMNSPGHRDNLLKPWATRMGLASAPGRDGRLYWALVLASEDEPRVMMPGGPFLLPTVPQKAVPGERGARR